MFWFKLNSIKSIKSNLCVCNTYINYTEFLTVGCKASKTGLATVDETTAGLTVLLTIAGRTVVPPN